MPEIKQSGYAMVSSLEFNKRSLKRLYRCIKRTYDFSIVFFWEAHMSAYFVPLITLPEIISEPGEYLTRGGDRVTIDRASTRHDYGCVGFYVECETPDKWHKSGRILATSETRNDIVRKASSEGPLAPVQAKTNVAGAAAVENDANGVQEAQATWAQKIKAIKRAAEGWASEQFARSIATWQRVSSI